MYKNLKENYPLYEVRTTESFRALLDEGAELFGDKAAFRFKGKGGEITAVSYREFRDDVDTFARALISLGVKRGDHVAIWATNVPQWYITFWATVKIGAVLVTVNTAYKIYEAEYLLRQSDTHTLVMTDGYKDSNYVEIIKELCPELAETESGKPLYAKRLPFLRNVITVDSEQPGCLTWAAAMDRAGETPVEEVYRRAASISKHDVCNMQYTSGTTGFPKAILHKHRSLTQAAEMEQKHHDIQHDDTFLCIPPLYHTGAKMHWFGSIISGSKGILLKGTDPKTIIETVSNEKCSIVWLLVPWVQDILDAIDDGRIRLEDYELSQWRLMHIGAQPVPPSLNRRWKE